ncbi:MAG: beta-galactosidase trimerization domain-containing protein, partial [Armatimonadetes bacterium]|nr:beta-galactosidase trimerization domain-containing protein [Armatimonadota bacterium]
PSVQYGRDLVELMQRLELEPTTVSIDREWDINCWGIGDYYSHEERGDRDDFKVVYGYVERDLTGPAHFEVIVIPGLNGWSRMTRASRDAILRRVQEGAGLVLIHPFVGDVENHPFEGDEEEGDTRLWDISPLVDCPDDTVADSGYPERNTAAVATGKWEVAQRHFITDGISLDLLPEGVVGGSFYKYRASGDVLVRSGENPIIAVKQYGKGRVVALAYVEQGFMPEPVDAVATHIYWDYWEYQYALLARCILWAADRSGELTIDGFRAGPNAAEIALFTPGPRRVLLEVTGGSAFGAARGPASAECQVVRDLRAGQNAIRVEVPMPHGLGKNIVSLIVRDAATGATLNWGAASFALDQPARLTEVTLSDTVYLRGDVLAASVRASGDLAGLSVRFQVSDDLGRILCAQTSPAAADATVEYRLAEFLGRYASVTAELVDSKGLVVDQLRATPVYVAPAQRRNREYRASLGFSSIRPYFGALRLNLMNAAGVQAGTTWSEGVDNGLDIPHSYFGVYWYRRGPTTKEGLDQAIADYQGTGDFEALSYNTKLELYSRTKDKRFLERTPCFDDAAILTDLYDRCHASAQAKSEYNMDYYFVGDEGSLTSYRDAFDFCWGEHTLAAFREWLEAEYGSLEALNAEWRTDFKDWQSVVPYTTEEAAASGNFAPWADHRTYMEIVFARAYKTARDGVVAADPDGHIAVSGTQATNAYNGCDWYRLDQVIDDFLSYGGGNQWDLHRSFAKPGSMIGFWTGYGSSGLGVQNGIWSAAIHSVLYPSIFWIYSYLNPDFTYSTSARDMGEAFSQLRFEGVGRLFAESERLHDGIAVHFSMPSVHADSIYRSSHSDQETLRSLSGATNGWVQMIKDLAMQFDFVSYDQIERGSLTSGEYRVLVLPLSLALSPEEVQAMEAFAEGGGIVIADAGAGMVDDHCAWVEAGGLNDFFGIATAPSDERVLARMPGAVTVTPEGEAWGLEAESLEGVDAVETVAATTGRVLLRIGDTDAVVVRQVGKGWAVYLNACLDRYGRRGRRHRGAEGEVEPPDTGPSYRSLVSAALAYFDVVPAVQVLDMNGQPLSRAQVVRYRFGQDEAVAIVTATVGARAAEGRDGVTVYHDENLGDVARQEITIRLPRAYHVTNARTGEQLGYTDTVRTTITLGGALVLGIAKEQNSLSVAGPVSATLGDHPQFIVRSSRPDRALVRAHFYGPDGEFLHLYAQNVLTENGVATVAIPSALNDQAGEYTVQATDVISGATAVTKIMLEPPVWAPSG